MVRRIKRTTLLTLLIAAIALLAGACSPAEGRTTKPRNEAASKTLTVYSGRSEKLILPLIRRFEQETGVTVAVRYGDTAELAATILEEGRRSPADVFISQDAAALGALAGAGMLRALPADVLDRVPGRYRAPDGTWVGLSGRARTIVYNRDRIDPSSLPLSLEQVADPRHRGRFGIAPTNSSLQAHLAAHRVLEGEAASRALLAAMTANDPRRYANNSAIVAAVIAGEIDFGLVNHYYLWQARAQHPGAPAENHFMRNGRASTFVNLAGAGVLRDNTAALALIRFFLSHDSQEYFATETYEYPVVPGIAPPIDLPPLDEEAGAQVDFEAVSAILPSTLEAIRDSGLLR